MVKRQRPQRTLNSGDRATPEVCTVCPLDGCALCDGLDHASRARLVAVVALAAPADPAKETVLIGRAVAGDMIIQLKLEPAQPMWMTGGDDG